MPDNKWLLAAAALLLSGCAAHIPARSYLPPSGPTVWNFTDPFDPLTASTGTAKLGYRDPLGTGWGRKLTAFSRASKRNLPSVNGIDVRVMAFPAAAPEQGYSVTHNSPPNGVYAGEGYVSNYTLVMDLLMPKGGTESYRSLYQTDAGNNDDGELFVVNRPGGGVGVADIYNGAVSTGAWHRLAWTVQCAMGTGGTGKINKFIDGRFVGGQYTPGTGARCRWGLDPGFYLFTDNDGETGRGFLTSLMYTDRVMTLKELAALGGPSGMGADVPGFAASAPQHKASKRVRIIGHRADAGNNPENTLAGIRQAFDAGADIVEVDVRPSADGALVLMHDEDVRRTTDGAGLVSEKSLSELKELDAGSWYDLRYAGERVPTLEEALLAAKGRGKLLLDVKGYNTGYAIQQALKKAGAASDAVLITQNSTLQVAQDFKDNVPGAPMIWSGAMPEIRSPEAFAALKKDGIAGFDLDISVSVMTKEFVKAAHDAGILVFVFTVLDPDTMLRMIDLGVDGMETDYPALLNSLMPATEPPPKKISVLKHGYKLEAGFDGDVATELF